MKSLEAEVLQRESFLNKVGVPTVLRRIRNRWQVEGLRPQIESIAKRIADGEVCLMPGRGAYILVVNERDDEAVKQLRKMKQRREDQKESLLLHPEQLPQYINFELLKELNPNISRKAIRDLQSIHPCGLILPCLPDKLSENVITYHEINGRMVPTILNTWVPHYRIFDFLRKALKRYPDVLPGGTSANLRDLPSPLSLGEIHPSLIESAAQVVGDPQELLHAYIGSNTILNGLKNPVETARLGNVDPDINPDWFRDVEKALGSKMLVRR